MTKKGVTLFELLAVILVLGIIVAISIPLINRMIARAENNSVIASLSNIEHAVYLRSLSNLGPVPQPLNPGTMTNQEWVEYSNSVFGEFIQGGWPSPAFGGYFVYREYLSSNQSNRWFNIDETGSILSIHPDFSLLRIEGFHNNPPASYIMLMLRFDNCDNTKRAVNVLINSNFSNRMYQYISTDQSKNVCTLGQNHPGENNIGIYLKS